MLRIKIHRKVKCSFFPTNQAGRDFVIGDLHGCYHALMRLLRAVNFSPKIDRLFSVGDLTDRGPQSSRCLRLLNRSWFFTVLGNHDIAFAVLNFWPKEMDVGEGEYYTAVSESGGKWYTAPPHADFTDVCDKLNNLPHVITVGSEKPDFHVVHASLHPLQAGKVNVFDHTDIDLYLRARNPGDMIHILTGDRELWDRNVTPRADGLSVTFCGHVIVSKPRWALGHLNINTGAGYPDSREDKRRLTMACVKTKRLWSVLTNKPSKAVGRCFPSH